MNRITKNKVPKFNYCLTRICLILVYIGLLIKYLLNILTTFAAL